MNFLFAVTATVCLIAAPLCFFLFFSREKLRDELGRLREKLALSEGRMEGDSQRLLEQQQEVTRMRDQLKLEFKNTAATLFDDMSQKFSTRSEKQIGDLLNPLRERLGEFHKKVDESFGQQAKEQFSLKKEIERIVLVNQQMQTQTENLTRALKGDVKAQGNWGEVMLERILEESGLRKGEDYVVQAVEMGLSDGEGNRLRPDVVVKLPENKHIIVDSKVSLSSYERYCGENDPAQQALHLKDFLKSVRAHVSGLEQKKYQALDGLGSPDFVLMFLPVEGAYSLAVQHDRELHSYAWGKKIVIVCPATLFATLRTVASTWRIELQNRNAQEIAAEGGKLYDKFVGFVQDMQGLGEQINRVQSKFDEAQNKLSTGTGNLIKRAEKLKLLGAKTTKSLPKELLEPFEDDDSSDIAMLKPALAKG